MKTPVTHERLQNHLTYSWWKYVLMMVLVIFFWSILFTTTRYRPPEEKKVIVGVYGAGNQTALDAYMEDVRQLLLPDMEEMNTQFIMSDFLYPAALQGGAFRPSDRGRRWFKPGLSFQTLQARHRKNALRVLKLLPHGMFPRAADRHC